MAATTKTWVDNSAPTCNDDDLNGFKNENNNLILGSGQSLDDGDNQQTHRAVSIYAAGGDFYTDSGVADAYVLTPVGAKIAPPAYFNGMRVRFLPANTNATPSATVNVSGLGVITINASPGEIVANRELVLTIVPGGGIGWEANVAFSVVSNPAVGLNEYLTPSNWVDAVAGGYTHAFLNDRWLSSHWGGMPDGLEGEVATGMLGAAEGGLSNISAGNVDNQIIVSKQTTVESVLLFLSKNGTPTGNITVTLNGETATIDVVTLSKGREWFRAVFSTPPVLNANTAYNLNVAFGGASIDWWTSEAGRYPYGGNHQCILIAQESERFLRTGGAFGNQFVCFEGNPINQSAALIKPLSDFITDHEGTILIRGESFTQDRPIMDVIKGIDVDRIHVRSLVTSGFVQVTLFELDSTAHTITGTTDVSTGEHDVAVAWRAKNDGADYLALYVDGVEEGTGLTSQSFEFSEHFRSGNVWLGGGLALPPAWAKSSIMNTLPSADGWVYTGGATEADLFQISNGVLKQNYAAGSGVDGRYEINPAGLNNATGWAVLARVRINTSDEHSASFTIDVQDGTRRISLNIKRYFLEIINSANNYSHEINLTEFVDVLITGQNDNYYVYANGKLAIDGTGEMTTVSAVNRVSFGDFSTGQGGGYWDFVRYNDAFYTPEISSCNVDEFGNWGVDKSALLANLYNEGSRISIRDFANLSKNIFKETGRVKIEGGLPLRTRDLVAILRNIGNGWFALSDIGHISPEGITGVTENTTDIFVRYSFITHTVKTFLVTVDETFATVDQFLVGASVGAINASIRLSVAGTPGVVDPTSVSSGSGNLWIRGKLVSIF